MINTNKESWLTWKNVNFQRSPFEQNVISFKETSGGRWLWCVFFNSGGFEAPYHSEPDLFGFCPTSEEADTAAWAALHNVAREEAFVNLDWASRFLDEREDKEALDKETFDNVNDAVEDIF